MMLKRPRQHEIDTAAQKFFLQHLPDAWICNEQRHDYGKDYIIEVVENGELTGESFWVQLKGQLKPQRSRDKTSIGFSLKKKHIVYYSERARDLPIFLVVVDVTKKIGWFVFVQRFLKENPLRGERKSHRVYLPLASDLTCTADFLREIRDSREWMRKRSTTIAEAVEAERENMVAIEPRCDFDISYKDGVTHYQLKPKQQFEVSFTVAGPPDVVGEKIAALEKGEMAWFEPGEAKFEGSPLFEKFEETGGGFQAHSETAAVLNVTLKDETGAPLATLAGIPGVFVKGISQVSFHGGLNNSPFAISYGPFGPTSCNFKVGVELTKWEGQPILSLAYFDQLLSFFKGSVSAESVESHWSIDGNSVARIEGGTLPGKSFKLYADFLSYIERMRFVCKKLGISPVFSVDKACESDGAVEEAFVLLNDGELSRSISNKKLRITGMLTTDFDLPDGAVSNYRAPISTFCTIMGEKVAIGVVDNEFTEMVVERHEAHEEQIVELELSPTANSMHIRRLVDRPARREKPFRLSPKNE